jgi:hypothetical protein
VTDQKGINPAPEPEQTQDLAADGKPSPLTARPGDPAVQTDPNKNPCVTETPGSGKKAAVTLKSLQAIPFKRLLLPKKPKA